MCRTWGLEGLNFEIWKFEKFNVSMFEGIRILNNEAIKLTRFGKGVVITYPLKHTEIHPEKQYCKGAQFFVSEPFSSKHCLILPFRFILNFRTRNNNKSEHLICTQRCDRTLWKHRYVMALISSWKRIC